MQLEEEAAGIAEDGTNLIPPPQRGRRRLTILAYGLQIDIVMISKGCHALGRDDVREVDLRSDKDGERRGAIRAKVMCRRSTPNGMRILSHSPERCHDLHSSLLEKQPRMSCRVLQCYML